MRKRYIWLGALLALVVASAGYVGVGTRLYEQYHLAYATYQFAPTSSCGTLIAWSPPTTLYTGLYMNQPSLVAVRYRSATPQMLHITVGIPHFTQDQTMAAQAAVGFQQETFKPALLDNSVLDALVGPDQREADIHLRVQSSAGDICDTTAPVLLKSRLWMPWGNLATSDSVPYLAGWITPQAPSVANLVGHAADWLTAHPTLYPTTSALYGYNAGNATPQDVRNQVNALFDTLQSLYHMRYAADNVPFDSDQRIQLPQDILQSVAPTGMCVETTVIMASAIERLGMRPYVIFVPGHAFLGVALGVSQTAPVEYWETSDLNGGVNGSQANVHGDTEYAQAQSSHHIVRIIDVEYERQQGIEPIE